MDTAAINGAVSAAEATLRAMKARDYRGIWARLSAASRETIVDETLAALSAEGKGGIGGVALLAEFREGGPLAKSYWDGFLAHFDPDAALVQSRWEAAENGPGRVLVLITYKTSDRPAAVKMMLEDGAGRFGLVETFWGRRE